MERLVDVSLINDKENYLVSLKEIFILKLKDARESLYATESNLDRGFT